MDTNFFSSVCKSLERYQFLFLIWIIEKVGWPDWRTKNVRYYVKIKCTLHYYLMEVFIQHHNGFIGEWRRIVTNGTHQMTLISLLRCYGLGESDTKCFGSVNCIHLAAKWCRTWLWAVSKQQEYYFFYFIGFSHAVFFPKMSLCSPYFKIWIHVYYFRLYNPDNSYV